MMHLSLFLSVFSSAVSVVLMALVNRTHHWKVLLAFSVLFFGVMAGPKFLIVLAISLFIYLAGFRMATLGRLRWVVYGLLLVPLMLKKTLYHEFHFDQLFVPGKPTEQPFDWVEVLHFVGLSYFTFNGLSYLVDIRRKYLEPQRNYFRLLLYLVYYPTIFSGPLHRAKYFFQQVARIQVTEASLSNGFRLVLWGLFKNMVLAQGFHEMVFKLQDAGVGGAYNLLTGFFFFFYLYCSFSSFIQIFQGISEIFNIRLKDNFHNRVYAAASRQEFWRGWHITLNEWFRDYFFYALIPYDKKRRYTYPLLFLTFLLIGLWHDFTWVFLLWGSLNATWIILEKKFDEYRAGKARPVARPLGVLYHLSVSSLLATVFISADVEALLSTFTHAPTFGRAASVLFHRNTLVLALSFLVMDHHERKAGTRRIDRYLGDLTGPVRWAVYYKLLLLVVLFGASGVADNYYRHF